MTERAYRRAIPTTLQPLQGIQPLAAWLRIRPAGSKIHGEPTPSATLRTFATATAADRLDMLLPIFKAIIVPNSSPGLISRLATIKSRCCLAFSFGSQFGLQDWLM